MSDVNAHIIQPLKKFAKDSAHLVKKCTKPDRKGACVLLCVRPLLLLGRVGVRVMGVDPFIHLSIHQSIRPSVHASIE